MYNVPKTSAPVRASRNVNTREVQHNPTIHIIDIIVTNKLKLGWTLIASQTVTPLQQLL